MNIYSSLVLFCTIFILFSCMKISSSSVIELTGETFERSTGGDSVWLVKFYAPWCGHCKKLAPIWDQLSQQDNLEFKVAKVDCDANKELCSNQAVKGFPTIKKFGPGFPQKGIVFSGDRTLDSFISFASESLQVYESKQWYNQPDDSIVLSGANFGETATGVWVVEFYAPWCGHCKALAPTWRELAAQENQKDTFKVAKINCEEQKYICDQHTITGFPYIGVFISGEMRMYRGARSVSSIVDYVEDELIQLMDDSPITVLTPKNFNKRVLAEDGMWLVKFYTPWCGHCKELAPIFESFANVLKENKDTSTKVGQMDCQMYQDFCDNLGIAAYPKIKLFQVGTHTGDRTVDSFLEFLAKYDPFFHKLDVDVITIDQNNINELQEDTWIVDFYAPWCGPCKTLAPIWESVATQNMGNVYVASINCETKHTTALCDQYHVKTYPTIARLENGELVSKYTGPRDENSITNWIQSFFIEEETDCHVLTSSNFSSAIKNGWWFVDFYAPWCTHCNQMAGAWEDLAAQENYLDRVNIAKVDCVTHSDICTGSPAVTSYPTLHLFHEGKIKGTLTGERTLQSLQQFLSTHLPNHHAKEEL